MKHLQTIEQLTEELKPRARATVPPKAKEELLARIKNFIENGEGDDDGPGGDGGDGDGPSSSESSSSDEEEAPRLKRSKPSLPLLQSGSDETIVPFTCSLCSTNAHGRCSST